MLRSGQVTPGMRAHPVGAFLSLSPNMDLRILALAECHALTLVHVDHHDAAYQWARQTRVLAAGAGQAELLDARYLGASASTMDEPVLPVPIAELLQLADDEAFLAAILGLSPEWQEWLLEARTDAAAASPVPATSSLVYTPMDDDDLRRALSWRLPAWTLFLHPTQRQAADDLQHRSIAVTGGPGTGKTAVLLNRMLMHSPRGRDHDCAVCVTYSRGLAAYLREQLRAVSPRYWYLFAGDLLEDDSKRRTDQRARGREDDRFRLVLDEAGQLVLHSRDRAPLPVRELLVDEEQDLAPSALARIGAVIAGGRNRVILAADFEQSIFRANQAAVAELISRCEAHYALTYCYRSTRQILEAARSWLEAWGPASPSAPVYGLSGPKVRVLALASLKERVAAAVEAIRDLERRYARDDLAVIYGQFYNPSFAGKVDPEEAQLKANPTLGSLMRLASVTKGREFLAGVLFVSGHYLDRDHGEAANRLRINTLYVALTRFRDEVTIIYATDSPVATQLAVLSSPELPLQ